MLKSALGVSYAEYAIVGFFAVVLGVSSLMTLSNQMDERRPEDFKSSLDAAKVAKLEEKYRLQLPGMKASIPVQGLQQQESTDRGELSADFHNAGENPYESEGSLSYPEKG
jgi:hypothetical protein